MELTPKEKIQKIIDELGISSEIQAKAMKVSVQTIYNKQNDKVLKDNFNEKNYQDFVYYIKEKASQL